MTWRIDQGDCRELMADMSDESFTACLTDPPYGLSFMGKDWDHGVPGVAYWAEVLRVLKPGAVLMAFGGTRTHHRLMVAIEDAGFEIFDCMMWLQGQGFPKSTDISKRIDKEAGAEREVVGTKLDQPGYSLADHGQTNEVYGNLHSPVAECSVTSPATPDAETWQGYGTALKPAWEPIVLARKPRVTTYAATALEHGSGAFNIDEGRVGTEATLRTNGKTAIWAAGGMNSAQGGSTQGRWPANLLLSHSPGCVRRGERRVRGSPHLGQNNPELTKQYGGGSFGGGKVTPGGGYADADGLETIADWDCVPECAVRLLGEQSGERKGFRGFKPGAERQASKGKGGYHGNFPDTLTTRGHNDTGTAARFFKNFDPPMRFVYSAKASRAERDAGLEGMPLHGGHLASPEGGGGGWAKDSAKNPNIPRRNSHPTVKPLAVTRYLATLLLPPESYLDDAVLLVPFCGVGSEMIGALRAGWRHVVGIELSETYAAMARRRIVADSPLWNHNGG